MVQNLKSQDEYSNMIKQKKFKICRRLGAQVYEKCQSQKFVVSTAKKVKKGKTKTLSDYGTQLIDKQRVRVSYGITEKQFRNYVMQAGKVKGGKPNEHLFESLETRLDNVIYRLGLGNTRQFARQMVSHGHFMVNGHKVTVPSYRVRVGDVITVREGSRGKGMFKDIEVRLKNYSAPNWLSFDISKIEAKVVALPKEIDSFLNLSAVLEFYSR
jgi:small subunit ribosomal protein S4